MGRRVLLAAFGFVLACGARTALLPGGPGGSGGTSGGSSGGGATPLAVKCTAALLEGAPTPMQGYCPTQANQASGNAPASPQIAWYVIPFGIDQPEDFLPAEIVVDPAGRAYVAIDASPLNPTGSPNQIIAIDPDGLVAWNTSFASTVSSLTLASDGRLWVMGLQGQASNPACENDGGVTSAGACAAFLTALSSSTGDVVAELDVLVPQEPYASAVGYGTMALAFDGSFFLGSASQDTPGGGVAHASVDGALLWQWPELAQDEGFQLLPPLLVGQDDGVVALGNGEILRFDVGGNQLWQEDLDAQTAAIDAQGDVVALTSPTGDDLALVTVDPTGLVVRTVALGAPQVNATQLALAGDGTTVLLLANEVASPGLTKAAVQILAIDTSGQTRWTTPLDVTLEYDPAALTTHYGLFVDGAGTVVVTAGAITGIDLSTGAILWTLQPPNAHACLRPAVLGAGGAILASQCDGTVFLARDP